MPQREGSTDYKYEDYSSKVAVHRLPQTAALVNQTMKITLEPGRSFALKFVEHNKVVWQCDDAGGMDWCEVVEVASHTYFMDMTFAHQVRESQTFIANTETRQVLGIRTIMREGDVGKEPRAVHEFVPGVLGDPAVAPTGRKPAPTRDLIGLRGLYDYGPEQCFEHIYLNSERYAWQCIIGPLRGQADVDFSTVYKFDDNQYVFAFREFGLPVSTVFFYNWDQMRSTGKFFAVGDDGTIANTPAGALIKKLSVAFYPLDMQPI
jgi:MoaF C-terminal domain/MoaF N-terminal domain